jgi:predicted NACHT family NTPase
MIEEYLFKKSLDLVLTLIVKTVKNTKFKLVSTKQDIDSSLNQHLRAVKNWSEEISFADLKRSKSTSEVFIELDLYVTPRRLRVDEDESIPKIKLAKLFSKDSNHIALLGQPGSGKTTSMKHLCQSILFDEKFYPEVFNFPLLIQLKDFNKLNRSIDSKNSIIYNSIVETLGIKITSTENQDEEQYQRIKEQIVTEVLNNIKALLIIDGFDELQFYNRREIVINELSKLAKTIESSRIILTSRSAAFHYSIEKVSVYELCPLNDDQILRFSHKWLKSKDSADRFLLAIRSSPFYDTTIRPLTIAHLCAIYERVGKIPDKPKTVYRKIINLLLEEWDEQKNIRRESAYAGFEIDRKFEFLSNLAYSLTTSSLNVSFTKQDLENIYFKIYQDFDLKRNEAVKVVREIESHSGLLVQAGFHQYEFAHKSLQEYLTAEFIVKLPTIPNQRHVIIKLPDELAIAVTISSSPSSYFMELINSRFVPLKVSYRFIKSFINRLLVEKPDFNTLEEVGISALLLYSQYLNSLVSEDAQLRLFYSDDLIQQFEDLIHSIFKRNTKDIINEHYRVFKTLVSDTGHNILLLQLIDKKGGFPKSLYCRDSFIK